MPQGRLLPKGGGDVTILGHATCHCSADPDFSQPIRIFHSRDGKSLLARFSLAPWRPSRDIYLLPLNDSSSSSPSLVSLQDSIPQASVQRHLCKPSHYTKLSL